MNKVTVDKNIPYAYEGIREAKIAKDGKVSKAYRGQISTLGAAITMGSIRSAVCYFSEKANNGTDVNRSYLLDAITYVLKNNEDTKKRYNGKELKEIVNESEDAKLTSIKEDIINAAIAIKLALNLYEWEEDDGKE